MKVSIVIPVYNGARYLRECLDSILIQDFPDMEIVIIDDGSTDGSPALIEQYAAGDKRIRWWKNPRNLGLSENFNCCLRAVQGDYVKFLLQDDKLLSPGTVRLMAAQLDADNSVSLVGTASQLLDAASQVTGIRYYFRGGTINGDRIIRYCMERPSNWIGEPSVVMFRRKQAERGFNERYRQLVDFEMWIHLLSQGNFAYLSAPLCAFRRHATQQTEVNRQHIAYGVEELMLYEDCYRQPWSRRVFTRWFTFSNFATFKRQQDPRWRALLKQWRRSVGPVWCLVFWVKWETIKNYKKLRCSTGKRMAWIKN